MHRCAQAKEELEQLKESERMQLARALASKACERALREVMREAKSVERCASSEVCLGQARADGFLYSLSRNVQKPLTILIRNWSPPAGHEQNPT